MSSIVLNKVQQSWFLKPREIEWRLYLGIKHNLSPLESGKFHVTLSYLDNQGEKWGETYIKAVGQHYDDYSNWSTKQSFYPLATGAIVPAFIPHSYEGRTFKEAAPGVTGLIGEVIVTTFLQKILQLRPFEIAHLKSNNTYKAPDFCLDIDPNVISNLLKSPKNAKLKNYINSLYWPDPLPVESKGRRSTKINHARDALSQLITYWRKVPTMAGYGLFTQIDLVPKTIINVHLLMPKSLEINNVRGIIEGSILPNLDDYPKLKDFDRIIGRRLIGQE